MCSIFYFKPKVPGNICLYIFYVYFSVSDFEMYIANIYENSDSFSSPAMSFFSGPR